MKHLTDKVLNSNLFPDSVYAERIISADASPSTYREFISGAQGRSTTNGHQDDPSLEKHCARVMLLRKGRSQRADRFIEMMVRFM